ncbi:MAG: phosphoglycerate mutase family protein [Gemmatimonadaceae bacterium]|nr:phosphoglycerate mutase family protein [Gemmatimonadaceae bacterium]
MISLPRRTATGLALLSFIALGGCAAAPSGNPPVVPDGRTETTVFLIRHAEKMSETADDPNLSARGRARAESLAVQLRDSGVNIIITSDLKRTIQTAAPLARLRHVMPKVIPIGVSVETHVDRTAEEVLRHPGATVLVVGHNNTVPRIVEKLGGGRIGDICTSEYSNLIILSITKGRPVGILIESYGMPDPPPTGSCPPLRSR